MKKNVKKYTIFILGEGGRLNRAIGDISQKDRIIIRGDEVEGVQVAFPVKLISAKKKKINGQFFVDIKEQEPGVVGVQIASVGIISVDKKTNRHSRPTLFVQQVNRVGRQRAGLIIRLCIENKQIFLKKFAV